MTCSYCATKYDGTACPHCGASNAFSFTTKDDWMMHYCRSGSHVAENIEMAKEQAILNKKRVLFVWNYDTIYQIDTDLTVDSRTTPRNMRWCGDFTYGYPYSR